MPARLLDRPGKSLAQRVAELHPEDRKQFLDGLTPEQITRLKHDWEGWWARPNQRIPTEEEAGGLYGTWLLLEGRGSGKTRTGSETVRIWTREVPLIALIGPSAGDVRDVMIEGESGILATSPTGEYPKYEPSKRRLTWPNGCRATTFGGGEDPDELRGPQFYRAWLDELAAWQYAEDAIDNIEFGLRLGDNPWKVVTTTPKPRKVIRDMVTDDDTVVTRESTYANVANLSPRAIKRYIKRYEGTRIARQELHAEILDDVPGALWTRETIRHRQHPGLSVIAVAVDPSVTTEGNEAGIVVGGRGIDGNGYVLADRSMKGSPLEWGKRAIIAYEEFRADHIVYEANQGGELVAQNLRMAALALGISTPPMKPVHATKGKRVRAEPVSNLYEQARVYHADVLELLETQLVTWTPEDDSPDRLDATVWLITDLMIDTPEPADEEYLKALQAMEVHR